MFACLSLLCKMELGQYIVYIYCLIELGHVKSWYNILCITMAWLLPNTVLTNKISTKQKGTQDKSNLAIK